MSLGTVKKDTLCLDATQEQIAIGGLVSQKVWVFLVKEGPDLSKGPIKSFVDAVKKRISPNLVSAEDEEERIQKRKKNTTITKVTTEIFRFINAGSGVSKIKLHPDGKRIAVLLPTNQTVEVWDLSRVSRLQSPSIPNDSCYMLWRDDVLLTAPLHSGIIQVIDTEKDKLLSTLPGVYRRIDAVAMFGVLCATGENRSVNIWSLQEEQGKRMASWVATKTFITALYMNDSLVISGSSAGMVKLWELRASLRAAESKKEVIPLRKISMKGVMHYPIKTIGQLGYLDVIVVAKYEAKKKKDKVKLVQIKGN